MTHAERTGAEAGDRAPRLERLGRDLGAVECLEPVADRIGKDDEILDPPFFGKRARAARNLHAACFQMRGQRVERRGIGDFPTVEGGTFVIVSLNDDPLLAIIHAQGERAAALVDELHAEEARAIGRPFVDILGTDADISQRL